VALHFVVLSVFVAVTAFDPAPTRNRPHAAFLLKETRLIDPNFALPSKAADEGHQRAGATNSASRGMTPPAAQRSLQMTRTPLVRSPLQISPASPELTVQLSQDLLQIGDLSGNGVLSALTSMPAGGVDGVGNRGTFGGGTDRSHGLILAFSALSQWPAVLYKVKPDYSEAARKAKCEGIVVLKLVIDEVGLPHDVRVVRGLGLGLDEKAVEAIYRWRFRPGYRGAEAVAVAANVELDFKLL